MVLLSNAPRPFVNVVPQLDELGVPADAYDAGITSGDVAREMLRAWVGRRLMHIGPERDRPLLDGLDLRPASATDAEAVLCSGLHNDDSETPADYAETLASDRRTLLERHRLQDVAFKVVGVGSVGTRCLVALLTDGDDKPLFLQIKHAQPSVLAGRAPGKHKVEHEGRRVVEGQRLTQASSDIFLGWLTGRGGRQFYVRQLRDDGAHQRLVRLPDGTPPRLRRLVGYLAHVLVLQRSLCVARTLPQLPHTHVHGHPVEPGGELSLPERVQLPERHQERLLADVLQLLDRRPEAAGDAVHEVEVRVIQPPPRGDVPGPAAVQELALSSHLGHFRAVTGRQRRGRGAHDL